ncbi:MAG: hypothetical protein ABJD07_06310 [Gemmatimonadaceae bacterium]
MRVVLHPRPAALQRFAAEECRPGERARVAEHLTRCARCRATVAATRELSVGARALEPPPVPPSMLGRVLADRAAGERVILPGPANAPETAPARARMPSAAAAVVLAAVALALLLGRHPRTGGGAAGADADSLPSMRGVLIAVGVIPNEAFAREAQAPSIGGIDGTRVRPTAMEYGLTYLVHGVATAAPERGTTAIESATFDGAPAWRIVDAWQGHAMDRPETTFVERASLRPLARVARNIGPSHFTIAQRFVRRGVVDSILGTIASTARTHPIARELPARFAPFLAGEGAPLLLMQSVRLGPAWTGSASIVGWGAVPSDLVYPIVLRVTGEERVTVPAGTFDCWTLTVTDGRREQRLWLRKSDQLAVMSLDSTRTPGRTQRVVLVAARAAAATKEGGYK